MKQIALQGIILMLFPKKKSLRDFFSYDVFPGFIQMKNINPTE